MNDTTASDESRRNFIKKSSLAVTGMSLGLTGVSAASHCRMMGANDKIIMGFTGVGNRGSNY